MVLAVELEAGGGVVTHDADGRALAVVRLMLVGYVEVGDAVTVVKIKAPLVQDKLDVARGIDVTVEVDVCHLKTVMVDVGRLLEFTKLGRLRHTAFTRAYDLRLVDKAAEVGRTARLHVNTHP